MKLVIFDLDQTLVDVISIHDEATRELFQRFFGVEARLTEIDFAGRSLTENFAELARRKNIPEDTYRQKSRELRKAYETIFISTMPKDLSRFVLPGARELLDELSRTENIVALYTGSSPRVVEHVLQAAGLAQYFRFTFSGTEVDTRAEMIKLAVEKAEKLAGKKFRDKDIIIIGDSVRDIEAGKQFNALTIAVATGFHPVEELSRRKPDYLCWSLQAYEDILAIIRPRAKVRKP